MNDLTLHKAINEAINELIMNEGLFSDPLGKRVKLLKNAVKILDTNASNPYISADTIEPTQETKANLQQAKQNLKYNRDQEINTAYQRALQAKDNYESGVYLNPQAKQMAYQRYQSEYQAYEQLKSNVDEIHADAQKYINSVNEAQSLYSKAFKQLQGTMANLSNAIKNYLQAVNEGKIKESKIYEDASSNLVGNIFRGVPRDFKNGYAKGGEWYDKLKDKLNFSKRKQEKAAQKETNNNMVIAIKQHRDKLSSYVGNISQNWDNITTNIFYFENYNDLYYTLNDMLENSSEAIEYIDESKVIETIKQQQQQQPQRRHIQ